MKFFLAQASQKALSPLSGLSGFSNNPGSDPGTVSSRFASLISNIITIITLFSGLAFLTWFIVGALTWVASAEHTDRLERAKNQMSTAILGLLIVILVVPIIYIVGKVIGFDILNSTNLLNNLVPD